MIPFSRAARSAVKGKVMGMNQSETVISQATILQALKSASRATLEVIFDAALNLSTPI
jgi:hypothetical protein